MKTLIVGVGETGGALRDILSECYPVSTIDKNILTGIKGQAEIIHICIPYSHDFNRIVLDYMNEYRPDYTVIHSTIPVGTTSEIGKAARCKVFHSPIRGKHPNIADDLRRYVKYISFNGHDVYEVQKIADYFEKAEIKTKIVPDTEKTELGKLLSLARYGVYIAFAKEQEKICEKFGLEYHSVVTDFEITRNEKIREELKQPLLFPFTDFVGGHCVVENMELLLKQAGTPLLTEAYKIGKATVIWDNCNIYPTCKVGKGCSIGQFTEIGKDVVIGNNVRIGKGCFIPEGVTIEDDVFIAPHVSFANDKKPPSDRTEWGKTIVKKGAVIGIGSVILPDIIIGSEAVIGAGSVVTKDVPDKEIWYGQAAYKHGRKDIQTKSKI